PRAFRSGHLDAVLDRLARRAMRSDTHVERVEDDRWKVSALFFWFRQDFVEEAGSVVAWIKRYGGEAVAGLDREDQLVQRDYDWRLNDRPR
ncbi:MAG TPA: hypothetical protein RMF84_00110, partial [Polyangiaceae bacterium LLY-WYZ-14_1]|nr:hypothetical protein [Polyangiaceae bacterium LLY-WYZ-14_1]